uniref:G_PROTEIN_RECEP_F1_2 domain-containing protein n=1 Tax=Macrostomum lignano TaxID=282301 RepID=A0A1I8F968_9PLAT
YLAICRPLKRHFSKKRQCASSAASGCTSCWALSPWLIYHDLQTVPNNNRTYLVCINTMDMVQMKIYHIIVIFFLLYAGPLLFIAGCYATVAYKLSRRSNRQADFLRNGTFCQPSSSPDDQQPLVSAPDHTKNRSGKQLQNSSPRSSSKQPSCSIASRWVACASRQY